MKFYDMIIKLKALKML